MEAALTHLRELFPKVDVRLLKAAIREHGTTPEGMDEAIQYLMDEAVSESSSSDGEISDKEDEVEETTFEATFEAPKESASSAGDVSDKEDEVEDPSLVDKDVAPAGFAPSGSHLDADGPESSSANNETANNEDALNESVNSEESFFEAELVLHATSAALHDPAASSDESILPGLSAAPVTAPLASSNSLNVNNSKEDEKKPGEKDLPAIGAVEGAEADVSEAGVVAIKPVAKLFSDAVDAADAAGACGATDGTEEEEEKAEVEKAVVVNESEGEPESELQQADGESNGGAGVGREEIQVEAEQAETRVSEPVEEEREDMDEAVAVLEGSKGEEEEQEEEVRQEEVANEGEEEKEEKPEKEKDEREAEEDEEQKEQEEEQECEHVEVPESLVNSWSRSFVEVEVSTIAHHVATTRDAKSRLDAQLASVQTLLSEVERAEQQAAAAETALSHAGETDVAEAENLLQHVVRSQQVLEIRAAQVFGHRAQLQEDSQGLKARVEAIQGQFAEVERQVEELRAVLEGRLERARERIGELEKRRREREEAGRRKLEGAEREMGRVLGEVPGLERQERACAELADALVARHHEADVLEGQLAVLREDLAALVRGVGRLPGLPGQAAEDLGYSFLTEGGEEDSAGQRQESYSSLHEDLSQASAAAAASAPDAIMPAVQVQAAPVTGLTVEDQSGLVAGVLGLTNASSPASVGDLKAAAAATSNAGAPDAGAGAAGAAAHFSELCSAQNLGASTATAAGVNAPPGDSSFSDAIPAAPAAAVETSSTLPTPSPFEDEEQFEAKMREMSSMLKETLPVARSRFHQHQQQQGQQQQQQQLQQLQVGVESALVESNTGVEGVTMIEDGDWSVLEASDVFTASGLGGASGFAAAGNGVGDGAGGGVGGVLEGADDEARWSGHSSFSVHAGSTPRAREGGVVRGESGEISEVMERYFGSSE
ncbi:unnamed protein product [Closterium sp. NIES-53]